MSIYPNILDISAYKAMRTQHPIAQPGSEYELQKIQHHPHTTHMNRHQITENVVDFFSHMFAPASYHQCTSSTPCWAPPAPTADELARPSLIVDDDLVVLKGNQDGAPLCREAKIAEWKGEQMQNQEVPRKRRRSIEWLANVIRKEGS